ncbi:MAG TPA: protein translocase subunit SecD [Gemmatimonadaceae bacterium]|nr:protein translocase subunit SecD [Gemmatimonadaceae bacterium]
MAAASIWALFPRTVVERVKRDGEFVYDTVMRVPLKKGLDLQGGMHLSLEIDESKGLIANKSEAIDRALKVVRTRIDEFGVSEPLVQKGGNDRIIVELPGIDDPRRAQDVVQKSAFLEFQITDETQALEKALPRLDAMLRDRRRTAGAVTPRARQDSTPAGLQSLFTADTTRPDSAVADSAALAAVVGGPGAFSSLIQQGQMPGEYYVAQKDVNLVTQYLAMPEVAGVLPPGKVLRWGSDTVSLGNAIYRPFYVLDARPIITGEFLTDAQPNTSPQEGNLVTFEMNNEGARRFRTETARHIKDYMAIVLDQRVMGRPPIIQSAIGANGQITMGGKDLQAAQDLALVLRAGSLPVPLKVVYTTQIGASLGQDSIQQGMTAGLIAIGLVVFIMVGYYRFAGVLAIAGLALYLLYTLAALAGFNAVLTLPGLAGFILSIGLAVDANVLIFERIREELALGKTIRTSVDEGFRHAMSAIVDSEVTTMLTAAVLYQYGTGPVRGFAVTLLAGTAASLFTAIFVVRTFFLVWLHRTPDTRTLSI